MKLRSLKIFNSLCILFILGFLSSFPGCMFGQTKLTLNSAMLYNFSTKGEAKLLVDEQGIANDPATGHGGTPITTFSPGWVNADIFYPAMIVLDLGKSYNLTSLWLFDTSDSDSIFIFTGDPSSWVKKAGLLLNTYNTWREVIVQDTTRFLMFRYPSPSTRVSEIVLYGQAIGEALPPPVPVPHPKPFIDQFMGVNGFINDPVDKLNCVGNVREYHNWGWDEGNLDTTYPGYPNNQYAWNPSWVSGPGWAFNFDDFYQQMKSNRLTVSPDLQGCALYITGFNDSLTQHKPIGQNENPLDPLSYVEHADYMFQFAARYGQSAVTPSLLKLRPGQALISGSGLVRYLENWNEPDKWWATRKGYFTPDELSTMCSADYDGHENSLGTGKGMKAADPAIKMVMGGLASLNLEYLRCMKLWSDYNRQTGFPADVLNFHHYSANGIHGISPEEDSLKQKLKAIVNFRDTSLPGKEIWLSEFGYDTNPDSEQAAVTIDTNDIYEVQGEWILRAYLETIAAGSDKAFVFMLRDANAANPNKYNSSGLTNEIWYGQQPKKSWFYVSTMKSQLKGLTFESEIPSGQDSVNVYKFLSANGDTACYTVWCTSSSNKIVESFMLDIGASSAAKLISPQPGMPGGRESILDIHNDTVSFRVTERPVFIRTILDTSLVPAQKNVNNVILHPGDFGCYNAVHSVNVAGNGTILLVQPGGSATFIAGRKVSLLPGTTVEPGGMLWAFITTSGSYCAALSSQERSAGNISNESAPALQSQGGLFRVYPTPTSGRFTLELNPGINPVDMTVFISGIRGEIVIKQNVGATRKMEFSLGKQQAGIYILRLMMGDRIETAKVIRL